MPMILLLDNLKVAVICFIISMHCWFEMEGKMIIARYRARYNKTWISTSWLDKTIYELFNK